ncbi:MAG: 3-keto-5-aminohexanoate cleavage protein [Polyangiales bacterium]
MIDAMNADNCIPEMECFDVGIVRSVGLYLKNGMMKDTHYNFVMGVASGMPCDVELLPLLLKYKDPKYHWQATLIGRGEIWPVHQRAAELGGMLRTGVEDTFYLPNGEKTSGNGQLIETLAQYARNAGREVASPAEARQILGLN